MTERSTKSPNPDRVGPVPDPPPDRLSAWVILDLLATARRWRARDQFIAGRVDALGETLVACLNAGAPAPKWLRQAVVGALMDHLWEFPRPSHADGARVWDRSRDALVGLWREEAAGRGELHRARSVEPTASDPQ